MTTMVWPSQKDAGGENTKINYGMGTRGEKKKRTSKNDSKKFRTRSMKKQGGMTFGFRKKATAVIKQDR
jgi:hypothetical protein